MRSLIGLGTFFPIFGLLLTALHFQHISYAEVDRQALNSNGRQVIQYMESRLKEVISDAEMLGVFAVQNQSGLDSFDPIANHVLQMQPMIRSIGIAPKEIIAKMYPLESNDGIVGFDLSNSPQYASIIGLARRNQKPVMVGPVELTPGNWGMKLFVPVSASKNEPWGFLTLTIKLSETFKQSEIQGSLGSDYIYRIARFDSERNEMVIISSSPNFTMLPDKKIFNLDLLGIWRVEMAPVHDRPKEIFSYLVAGLASLVMTVFGIRFYNQNETNKTLARYDKALGYPNRVQTILKADRSLKRQGLSVVIVIQADEFSLDAGFLKNIKTLVAESLLTDSLDTDSLRAKETHAKDMTFMLDNSHFMTMIGGLSSTQMAKDLTEKLYNKLKDHRKTIGLSEAPLKIGACVTRGKRSRVSAISEAVRALRSARAQDGDALSISSNAKRAK
ncbi:MAG: CHASE domain-containing protein [Methylococcales bacterium]|nr:CHASE domain-containing protein [Methylococcales bacterium]